MRKSVAIVAFIIASLSASPAGAASKNGIYILENVKTAELARDSAWEFMFVLGFPKWVGAVQAMINPIAIR